MNFIATVIVLYLIFRLISYVVIRFLAYKVKKAARMAGYGNEEAEAEESQATNKKKIFQKDEGDYVEFEEVDKSDKKPNSTNV